MRAIGSFCLIAALTGCDCGDGSLSRVDGGVPEDSGIIGCRGDEDCPDRYACNTSLRFCVPLDECGPNQPCPVPQVCEPNDDGYLRCTFERCEDDSECSMLECPPDRVPACLAGACTCGVPCQGGCPPGQGCCIPTEACLPLPAECMGLTCAPGQFVSVTSSGAWSLRECRVTGESCSCEDLPPLPEGDIGLYSALDHDGRSLVVSAYNLDYGDLMFGIADEQGDLSWEFVDGVPTTTTSITGATDGPRGGNSDPGPDVGAYTDLVADGRPQIAYYDRDRGALKYATLTSNGWQHHEVDGSAIGDTGLYASIALDAGRRPVIAYLAAREVRGSSRISALRIAFARTATPTGAADWATRDLDTYDLSGLSCDDRCNSNEVCLAGGTCAVPENNCNPRCNAPEVCVARTCRATERTSPFRDLPQARGLWPSLGFLPDGTLLILYHDRVAGSLKAARITGRDLRGGPLTLATIDAQGETGLYPSLFVTPGGELHVSYMNATRQALLYRTLDPQLQTVILETVIEGIAMGTGPDGVIFGADSAVVVDAPGIVRIAYQDATHGDLRYARRAPGGVWSSNVLAGESMPSMGSFGFYSDQVLLPGRQRAAVSTYRYFLAAPNGPDNGVVLFQVP